MTTDEYGNVIDDGYPIRVFDSEIRTMDWLSNFGHSQYRDRDSLIYDSLKTQEGKKLFSDFLKTMNSAPSLEGLKEEADEDVYSLLESDYLKQGIQDLISVAANPEESQEKTSARKTLEGLVAKGYPEAQRLYGELLVNEGNTNKAHDIFIHLESNPYATEFQSDEATRLRMENPKKSLRQILSEHSEKPKEPSFMELANSAKNLDDVSEENLSAEEAKTNKHIVDKFFDKPFSEYKPEDVKALEILSDKKNSLAQKYLLSYYSEKGQFSRAFSMADNLRRNPYAPDHFTKHAQDMAKELLPLARKEQMLKSGGR